MDSTIAVGDSVDSRVTIWSLVSALFTGTESGSKTRQRES